MGMLTSALLVFGRFSADQELTAVRASGISLISLVSPVLLLSLVMCGLSAWVNLELAPKCRAGFKDIVATAQQNLSSAQLPEGRYIKDFPGYIFYVGKNRMGALEDVTVLYLPDETNVSTTVVAPRGQWWIDQTNGQLRLKLFEVQSMTILKGDVQNIKIFEGGDVELEPFDLRPKSKSTEKLRVGNMTFVQLLSELRDVENSFAMGLVTNRPTAESGATVAQVRKQRDKVTSPIRVEIHRQLASSFACFAFTLVGIPLGIRVHRRETNIGFFMALILVMIYYTLLLLGAGLDTRPEFYPHVIVWVPNLLFQAVGVVLLWRANRGI
jgi:lipopolysaccharide export system permease protein